MVSKRLMRGGAFAGAAIISFDVVLLRDTWESLGLDDISTVSLIRSDGQLVARYPLAEGPLDLSKYVLFTDYLPKATVGTYPATSPADGVTRIVGYRRVEGTPYIALASISTESAFALFRRNTFVRFWPSRCRLRSRWPAPSSGSSGCCRRDQQRQRTAC